MWSPLALAYPLGLGLSGFRGEERPSRLGKQPARASPIWRQTSASKREAPLVSPHMILEPTQSGAHKIEAPSWRPVICGVCSRLRVLQVAKASRLWSLLALRDAGERCTSMRLCSTALAVFLSRTSVESSRATLWRWPGVTGGG
jgi:hypothetical protein